MRLGTGLISLSAATVLLLGGVAGSGCGEVTPEGTGKGGGGGNGQAGAGGGQGGVVAGSGGGGGSAGTDGGRGGSGTAGTDGSGAGGKGGGQGGSISPAGAGGVAAGGRGGSDSAGAAGSTGAGGVATGGRGGGNNAGAAGSTGTGGVATGGRGGSSTAGVAGSMGTGGAPVGGRGGGSGAGAGGTGGVATCVPGTCPPLLIGDLQGIDDSGAPGFAMAGFRCKALAVCATTASCVYFAQDTLGSVQSGETGYTDGPTAVAAQVKLSITGGAASQCGDPAISLTASDTITLTFDGSKKLAVYLPAFMGTSLTLYIASDGSTFRDAALTMPARLHP